MELSATVDTAGNPKLWMSAGKNIQFPVYIKQNNHNNYRVSRKKNVFRLFSFLAC